MKKLLKVILTLTVAFGCVIATCENDVSAYIASGERTPLDHTNFTVTVSGTNDNDGGNKENIFDNSNTSYWTSESVAQVAKGAPYLIVDMAEIKLIDRVDITKRYDNGAIWNCTGNMTEFYVEVATNKPNADNWDGVEWTTVYDGAADADINSKDGNNPITNGTSQVVFNTTKARYIRISAKNTYHWQSPNTVMTIADLKVFGPESTNVARSANNSKVTTKAVYLDGTNAAKGGDRPMSMMFDGTKNNSNYGEFGSDNTDDFAYAEIDLGDVYSAQSIHLYRYWGDTRTYHNTIVVASDNAEFTNPVYLYNTNTIDKSGIDPLVVIPETADEGYNESSSGKLLSFDDLTNVRYVRVYMHGTSTGGTTNHIVELEVNAYTDLSEADMVYGELSNSLIRESQYTDHTGTTLATADTKNPVTKFVTPKVLSVKAQSALADDGDLNVRFITSIPSVNLEKLKFKVEVLYPNGDRKAKDVKTNRVFGSIVAKGVSISDAAKVFDNTVSTHFAICKLDNISKDLANDETIKIRVTPYWLPYGSSDETENYVEGKLREFTVKQLFEKASPTETISEVE